jgi:hypothetical protein
MPAVKFLSLLVGVLLVSVLPGTAEWAAPVAPEQVAAFVIPKALHPPVIDGAIGVAEWRHATAISGVGNSTTATLLARPTTFFLQWDAGHLYLAVRTWVRPGGKPFVAGRAPGLATTEDAGAELHFQPLGKNVAATQRASSYRFLLNCLGFDGELHRLAIGQANHNWTPHFQRAVRETPPGSAPLGGHWWECEWAAVPQDFDLVGPHRAGDQWRMRLGFNQLYAGWMQACLPIATGPLDPAGFPLATLVEASPAAQLTMDEFPGLLDGIAALKIRASNPTSAAITVTAHVEIADAQGVILLTHARPLPLAAGQVAEFSLHDPLPGNFDKPGTLKVSVRHDARELLRYFTYFTTDYPKEVLAPLPPASRAFPLQATFNPITSSLQLTVDTAALPHPERVLAVRYQVVRSRDGAVIAKGLLTRPVTAYYRQLLTLPALDPGAYTAEAALLTREGKKLGPERVAFTKRVEATAFAPWWRTKVAELNRVIPPFIPLHREGTRVKLWGRAYDLGPLGLPRAITSGGRQLLAAPARVVAVINGKTQEIPLTGTPFFTLSTPWRLVFTGRAAGAGLSFTVWGRLEQDGLTQLDLTYAPSGKTPVTVEALRLEFPLDAAQAECLLCLGPGGSTAARTTMLLPNRPGKLWSTLDTGRRGSGMTVGSFYPCVWLGNEERGLLWWADRDKGWVPDDAVPAHEVVRKGTQVVLRNNLIGKPYRLAAPRTVTFAYMASPFRPLPKGWRAAIHAEDGTFSGPHKSRTDPKTGQQIDGWNWITPPARQPQEWSALWAQYKKEADAKIQREQPFDPAAARRWMYVHTSLPLLGHGWKSPDTAVTSYFAADWDGDSWTKSEQDYFLWLADRAFREGGLRTIYWDDFTIARFTSLQNGLAYELPDGRIQPGFNGLNVRRFLMRLYALMGDHGLHPGAQMVHAPHGGCLVAVPWVDAILAGESPAIPEAAGLDWVDGYPVARMRALATPATWGVPISWMPRVASHAPAQDAQALRGFTDYPRLFDSWAGPNGVAMPEAVLDWGLNGPDVRYHPFWRNPYVASRDQEILVSLWRQSDRILLAVFNNSRTHTKNAALWVDLPTLKLLPELPWQEFLRVREFEKDADEPSAYLDLPTRNLTVPALKPHTGRLIGIRRY